ncbi:MAG: type II toxin-antitoxin system RelE/ParE family toxin [Rhodospirillaceae bacterium]|nr:type II toxin-antitoxin system RelE/ParE family toxin [Rhodospirillaceae bacterium]
MTMRLLAAARDELDSAISWYNAQGPGLGDAFLSEILKTFRLIEQHPRAWHPLTAAVRRCRLARFPYGVIYAVENGEIVVLAVAHLHRAPGYWNERLPAKS